MSLTHPLSLAPTGPRRRVRLSAHLATSTTRVLRVSGVLCSTASTRVLRLVDAFLAPVQSGSGDLAHLVVDLTDVETIRFGAVAGLQQAADACRGARVGLHLAGATDRDTWRDPRIAAALAWFSHYPSAADAVADLAVHDLAVPDFAVHDLSVDVER